MKYRIGHGVEFESLTRGELDDALGAMDVGASWFQEFARGVKPIRLLGVGTVTAGAVTVGAGAGPGFDGPEQGCTWAIRRRSVAARGTGDTLKIYRNGQDVSNFIGTITAANPRVGFGSTEFLLLPTDQIVITGTGLTTTATQLVVTGEGIEVPSFMVSKLL